MVPRLMCLVSSDDNLALLPALAMAGVDSFQVRDKSLDRDRLIAFTNHVMNLVPAAKVIVNDRIDVAVITGADGVHVGASDMPVAEVCAMAERARVRGFLPERFVVGATCRTAADVAAATAAGASYVGVGPVFATTSKDGLPDPLGVEALGAVVGAGGAPVLAIGGIGPDNVAEVVAQGVHGVAVIGGIWRAPSPVDAARELVAAVRSGVSG